MRSLEGTKKRWLRMTDFLRWRKHDLAFVLWSAAMTAWLLIVACARWASACCGSRA
jgi:hypothetical protein